MSMDPGYSAPPPARSGKPWWVWALGGCGGCLVIVLIAMVAGGVWLKNMIQGLNVGPVTQASIQQQLGEVPLYPRGEFQADVTRITLQGLRFAEKVARREPGSMFKTAAVVLTSDSPQQVLSYYDQALGKAGWKRAREQNTANAKAQHAYQKGQEMVIVQAQQQQGRTQVVIMRGGLEMAQNVPQNPTAPGTGSGTGGGTGGGATGP